MELVGPAEAAQLTGLKVLTIHQYRSRGLMPEPVRVISRTPLWEKQQILDWDRDRNTRPGARKG